MSAVPPAGQPAQFNEDVFALAEVYADALLEAADEKGQAETVAVELAELAEFMERESDFRSFLTAETVDDEPRRATLEKLFRGRMSDLLLNTLQVLNNRGRMGLLPAVIRAVQLRMEQRHHQQEVTVESAFPLSDGLRSQIAAVVSAHLGKEALLIEEVRPDLIGGLVIHIGDTQVDASVATRLRTMRKRLTDRASVEVHRGRGYATES